MNFRQIFGLAANFLVLLQTILVPLPGLVPAVEKCWTTQTCREITTFFFFFFVICMFIKLHLPSLESQVHAGATGCLEQTNNLWGQSAPQVFFYIKKSNRPPDATHIEKYWSLSASIPSVTYIAGPLWYHIHAPSGIRTWVFSSLCTRIWAMT